MARKRIKNKITKPNVLSFIAYTLILFLGTTILVNVDPNANESYRHDWKSRVQKPMEWIFLGENGETHNLYQGTSIDGEHASAENWEYLIPSENEKQSSEEKKISTENILEEMGDIKEEEITLKVPQKAQKEIWNLLEDRSIFINMIFEYMKKGKIKELPEGAIRYVVLLYNTDKEIKENIFKEQACITPWGYKIDHGASVLAYNQRSDSPNICNLERRICRNGKLSGSFTQSSCDENLNGNIKKRNIIEHNKQSKENEYIQPSKLAKNSEAEFNMEGKVSDPQKPDLITGPNKNAIKEDAEDMPQEQNPRKFCYTPWGEKVKAGQFVKAYKYHNGFFDIPCSVQIRLCVNGELEGTYEYPNCQPRETSYEDFIHGYIDGNEPSPQRLIKMLKTPVQPEPKYGNKLSTEIIEQLLDILQE